MATSVREQRGADGTSDLDTPRRPAALNGLLAAGIVYGSGLVLCAGLAIIVWLASDGGSAPGAVRAGAGFWLAGHGSTVTVGATTITVVPLGVPLLVAAALGVAGWRLSDGTGVAVTASSAAGAYGAALAVTALLAGTADVSFSAVRAGAVGFAVAGLSTAVGVSAVDGRLRELWETLPEVVRGVVAGTGWAFAAVFVSATAVATYSLLTGLAELTDSFDALGPGMLGGVALALVCVLALPNAVLFTTAVLLGPGFAIGADTSVTLTEVRLGDVPTVPLLAALPDPGTQPAWMAVLGLLPVLAGVVGGVVAVRGAEIDSVYDALSRGCIAGGCAGILLGLSVMAAGGAIGPGRMSEVGAVVWCVPIAVVALTVGGTAGGAVGHYRERRVS